MLAQEEPANIQATPSDFPVFSSQQTPNGYEGLQDRHLDLDKSVVQP